MPSSLRHHVITLASSRHCRGYLTLQRRRPAPVQPVVPPAEPAARNDGDDEVEPGANDAQNDIQRVRRSTNNASLFLFAAVHVQSSARENDDDDDDVRSATQREILSPSLENSLPTCIHESTATSSRDRVRQHEHCCASCRFSRRPSHLNLVLLSIIKSRPRVSCSQLYQHSSRR